MEYTTDWERSSSDGAGDTVSLLIDEMPVEAYALQPELRELMDDAPITQVYIERADGMYPLRSREDDGTSNETSLVLNSEQQEAVQIALLGGSATVELLTPFGTDTTEIWSIQTYSFSHITPEGERCFTLSSIIEEREIRHEENDGDIEIPFVIEEDVSDEGDYGDGDSGYLEVIIETSTADPRAEMLQAESVIENVNTVSVEPFAVPEPTVSSDSRTALETTSQLEIAAPAITITREDSSELTSPAAAEAELEAVEVDSVGFHPISTEEVVFVDHEISFLRQDIVIEEIAEVEAVTARESAPITESVVSMIEDITPLQEFAQAETILTIDKAEKAEIAPAATIYEEQPALTIEKLKPQIDEIKITEDHVIARAVSADYHDAQSVSTEPLQASRPDVLLAEKKDENSMVTESSPRIEVLAAAPKQKAVYRATHDQSINHNPQELEDRPTWRTTTPERETVVHERFDQELRDISTWEKEMLQSYPHLQPSLNLLSQFDEDIIIPFEVSHGTRIRSRRIARSRTV